MFFINHPSQINNDTIGQKVIITGWAANTAIHKNIVFLYLRRDQVYIQCITKNPDIIKQIKTTSLESYIKVTGTVIKRNEKNINPNKKLGNVEIDILAISVISYSKELPVSIKDIHKSSDYVRTKWKFLDLRNEHTLQNVMDFTNIVKLIRLFMYQEGIDEITTPIITLGTPEGAKDYLVASQEHPGLLYALAQSPQVYKQLLMIGGLEKYFQIAPCFRNETARKNRIPICFYQLDIEMITDSATVIHNLIFKLISHLIQKHGYTKEIQYKSINYEEAIKIFNSDKVDLRVIEKYQLEISLSEGAAIINNVDNIGEHLKNQYKNIVIKNDKVHIPFGDEDYNQIIASLSTHCNEMPYISYVVIEDFPFFKKDSQGKIAISHNPFSDIHTLHDEPHKVKAKQYDVVINGQEAGSGSIRNTDRNKMIQLLKMAGYTSREIDQLFGRFLEALSYGTPPHAGIALGIERICSILKCKESVKEFAAFQYLQNGEDPLLGSPRPYSDSELSKYGIKTINSK